MTSCRRQPKQHASERHPSRKRSRSRPMYQRLQCRIEKLETRSMLAGDSVPSIDPVADLSIHEDAGLQIISLSGISEGEGTPESVRISASSDNLELVDHPEVTHQPGQATGEIRLEPKPCPWCSVSKYWLMPVPTTISVVADNGHKRDFHS